MKDSKKIEIFDKCLNEKIQNYIDSLNEVELDNLCNNVSKMVKMNTPILKVKIKSLSRKK